MLVKAVTACCIGLGGLKICHPAGRSQRGASIGAVSGRRRPLPPLGTVVTVPLLLGFVVIAIVARATIAVIAWLLGMGGGRES